MRTSLEIAKGIASGKVAPAEQTDIVARATIVALFETIRAF